VQPVSLDSPESGLPPVALRLLTHRRSIQVILALGALLGLATLRIGFYTDDFTFIAFLEKGGPLRPSIWGLYDFAGSAPWKIAALMARGPFRGGRLPI